MMRHSLFFYNVSRPAYLDGASAIFLYSCYNVSLDFSFGTYMLSITQLSMRYGAKILFRNVSIQFNSGCRYGLVGANGSGKSTLIKILSQEVVSEKGEVVLPQNMSIGFLKQDHYLLEKERILDVVLQGRKKLWKALCEKKALLENENFQINECETLEHLESIIEEEEGYASEGEAAKLLEGLGIRQEWHMRCLEMLSGGYKLRVLLAQVLFARPDVLILDEPTNHLDLYSIKWLEEYLKNFPGTLIVASHDRDFLNKVTTHTADVDYGTIKLYKGNYDAFLAQKRIDRELKEQMLEKQDKRRADLQEYIDRFGAKSSKAKQAQSKAKIVEKIGEKIDAIDLSPSSRLYPSIKFTPLRPSGVTILTVQGVQKAYGEKKVLENVSFEMERGEKAAIIGPNGIGKSTLLEILTGNQTADKGSFQWGHAVRPAYFPQAHAREIRKGISLLDWLGQFDPDAQQEKLRGILGSVLFTGEKATHLSETLSGGEIARLILAKMMLQKPNVLIFDEPTNHLDMEAIEELTQSLEAFEGTLLLVSHNRHFVSRLATRIIEISYEGVKDFRGTYEEFLEKEQRDLLSIPETLKRNDEVRRESSSSSSYANRKHIKSQIAQLKKKAAQAEERCHQLELKIEEINRHMAADGFYQRSTVEEQQQIANSKRDVELQLEEAIATWERESVQHQQMEEFL
jgi:ATPase subunit of ABC transporter with duplicated ATPase domains